MKLECGYEYSALFKRPLSRSYGNLRSFNHFFIASFGICDWFSLDGKIGLGDVRQKGGIHLPKLEYNTSFAGGYGFRIKLIDYKKTGTRLIAGAQHVCVHPQARSIDDDKYTFPILDDWQVSAIVSQRIKFVDAYAGLKLSDCEMIYSINKHDRKRRFSRKHLGFVFGSDIYLFEDKVRINIEARFFDETAFSTAAAYLF